MDNERVHDGDPETILVSEDAGLSDQRAEAPGLVEATEGRGDITAKNVVLKDLMYDLQFVYKLCHKCEMMPSRIYYLSLIAAIDALLLTSEMFRERVVKLMKQKRRAKGFRL
jgi:hypothetical protein